jgi:glucose/arabinose dehydrogenase
MPPLPGDLVIGDLKTPRGIAFDAAGNLVVTIVGEGGSLELMAPNPEDPSKMMAVKAGLSGSVISVGKDGKATPLISGLPSYATESEIIGVYRAIPQGDSLWLVVSGAGPGNYWADSVVELDAKSYMLKRAVSLYPFEAANNPDGNEIDSNAADIAWLPDGTMLIADAGANALLSWTEKDGLKVVAAWKENSVPTSVEVSADGDIYVGFLGAGLAPGAGKIEHWSKGALKETFGNLNAVTDILLDGNNLYAIELTVMTDQGPGPGRVVKVDAKGATPVAEGLITPFGIAKGPDGALYVSFGTVAFQPGMTGGVVKLKSM